ncbi:Putative K+-transporting ATPase, F subunit [Planktothrix tepida]|uniref:K+-transporting ATPase, F subunit n=2 Tax=Planktothrix TaxID=54304 RepID=A0A9W4G9Q3_9CYAN|nr:MULTISPECIES: potassium-transporting ATPase subunit F [Planktothrix]CAD5922232.1 Putative K+-transporting ATPase, F subunit [Planktothrix tepida]CAD5982660.1 Putative K+-transporting ATPase, F subunit [Planktothrix pseudagardhii]CUR31028.1 putative K+-transporting ATPase, F subunit [Planktothrix tepida PCC 9214]
MKKIDEFNSKLTRKFKGIISLIKTKGKPNLLPLSLFFLLSSNLIFAPIIYAATGEEITRKAAWAIGVLILVTIAIALYLLAVILQPERF